MARFRTAHVFTVLALLGLCGLASGCGGNSDAQPATAADISALKAAAAAAPTLQAGEKIHVTVYDEPTLTGDYPVDPSGYVALPVIGTLQVAGMTTHDLENRLVSELRTAHIKDPGVTVEIMAFRPFYILGEVEKPGAYDYIAGLNVLSALAIAGGRTYRGEDSTILIQHAGETTMHEYPLTWPIPVLPGDIIQVPRRYI